MMGGQRGGWDEANRGSERERTKNLHPELTYMTKMLFLLYIYIYTITKQKMNGKSHCLAENLLALSVRNYHAAAVPVGSRHN